MQQPHRSCLFRLQTITASLVHHLMPNLFTMAYRPYVIHPGLSLAHHSPLHPLSSQPFPVSQEHPSSFQSQDFHPCSVLCLEHHSLRSCFSWLILNIYLLPAYTPLPTAAHVSTLFVSFMALSILCNISLFIVSLFYFYLLHWCASSVKAGPVPVLLNVPRLARCRYTGRA